MSNKKAYNDALTYFAKLIIKFGESGFPGQRGILPTDYRWPGSDVSGSEHHDAIVTELDATHYDLAWDKPCKSVRIRFYRGDSYGACLDLGDPIRTEVVEIDD